MQKILLIIIAEQPQFVGIIIMKIVMKIMIISNSRWGTTMCGKPYMGGQSRCSIIISVSKKTLFV